MSRSDLMCFVVALSLLGTRARAAETPEDVAQRAADSWLKLVDDVVIQYDAVFENKAMAIETVTPMLDANGVWRVSGYFIK